MPYKQPDMSSYSPAELMRYATGQMSAAEMYALEKAALEDTFLAEALDGYMEAMTTQPIAEVQAQAKRLQPVVPKQEARIIPLWQRKSVRVAVAALFIAGAGWSIFSLLQKPSAPASGIVQQTPLPKPQADTIATIMVPLAATDANSRPFDSAPLSLNSIAQNKEAAKPVSSATALGAVSAERTNEPKRNYTVSAAPYSLQKATAQQSDTDGSLQDMASMNEPLAARQEKKEADRAMRSMQAPTHVFKGQVTDEKNNPVPYANIMLEGQDFGTYSDVSGHFNFVSEDSVLHIRVRSVGYDNQTLALQNNRPETRIVLQEDLQLNNSLPLTVQKSKRSTVALQKSIVERDSIVGLEAANVRVPFYDIYLLNNNRISPLPTLNREVQLSFDVSKNGEAANIKVVKSSGGKTLDNEAIRLVKEGPKLVGDTTINSRKKVTVRF